LHNFALFLVSNVFFSALFLERYQHLQNAAAGKHKE